MFIPTLLFVLSFVSLSLQQKDPLKDFCRIHSHQTTVVDRKLYVDGGLVNWGPLSQASLNYSSTWIREGDLDDDNEGFPQQSTLAKNETVPSVHGGVLWSDASNKIVYMYGGEFNNGKPEDFSLWYYDIVYNTWNVSDAPVSDVKRASYGAGAVAQDKGRGYYYGGWLTNASVPGYGEQTALSNMLVYDMLGNKFRNQSGPDDIPRAEGVMTYVPAGDAGLLVYFGGIELSSDNGTAAGRPMSDILVYSIGDDIWYTEKASGDVPEERRRFCAGGAWAEDRSSYNIYTYGGASIGEGNGFGDVYVLSLPSFTWIKFWPRTEDEVGATFPHHSLTCDVIGNSQMIIMGGHFPNMSKDCDVPTIYGQHGLDLGKQNPEGAKWAMFKPNLTTYAVPTEIVETIGGGATGGATVLAPTRGFQERDLQIQFSRPYKPETRAPTRYIPAESAAAPPPGSEDSNRGATIGGAVGGALGGLLLVAAIGFCVFFYRRKKSQNAQGHKNQPVSGLPSNPNDGHLKSPGMYTPSTAQPSPLHSEMEWSPHPLHPAPQYPGQAGFAYSPHPGSPGHDGFKTPYSPPMPPQELPAISSPALISSFPNTQPGQDEKKNAYYAHYAPKEMPGSPV